MEKKAVLVAFNGELMTFVHVLLHALDMEERGYQVKLVIEGSATKTVNVLNDPGEMFNQLYCAVRDRGLISAVCQACAVRMGALEGIKAQGLPLAGEMQGHPGLAKYLEQGWQVLTF